MGDLPPVRLRLFQPAFYYTGVDCFGPYIVTTGWRREKKQGVVFKYMTKRAINLDLLAAIDTDFFQMALRRFMSCREKPFKLLSDQGTKFKGGERVLKEAFAALGPEHQAQLAPQQIKYCFNPLNSLNFGGC